MAKVYGYVNVGSNKKQFTVLEDGNKYIDKGFTFKLGRIERMLHSFSVGDLLVCTVLVRGSRFNVTRFESVARKEIADMSGKYFVSLVAVDSQVPTNIRLLTERFGAAAMVKTAWFCVASTGSPFVLPLPLERNDAVAYALELNAKSNGVAVVVDDVGEITDLHEVLNKASAPAPKAAPVVAPVPAKVDEPKPTKSYFYFEESPKAVLSIVASRYKNGFTGHVNILVTGETGTGKTSVAKQFAEKMGWAAHRLNCALITEPSDIAGQRGIKNGETVWEWSAVAKAMQEGNCVVILDELNRAYPNALNSLFGLLDDDRRTWFNDLELKVGPNVVFFATVNNGSQYTGTFQADAALLNRFEYVFEMGNIPDKELTKILESTGTPSSDAKSIVRTGGLITSRLPDIPVSVRTLKAIASAMSSGMNQRQAWQFVLVGRVHESLRRDLIDLLNNNISLFDTTGIKMIF